MRKWTLDIWKWPLRWAGFYLLIFTLFRLVFYGVFQTQDSLWESLVHAIRLDVSMTSYLLVVPMLFFQIYLFWPRARKIIRIVLFVYFFVVSTLVLILEASSIFLFKEWGATFNARAYSYLTSSMDGLRTSYEESGFLAFLGVAILIALTGLFIRKFLIPDEAASQNYRFGKASAVLLAWPFLFLGIRGGWQKLPINVTASFYSTAPASNFTAVNKGYYFMHSMWTQHDFQFNPKKFSDRKLEEFSTKYFQAESETENLFRTPKPNVILVIMEGVPASLLQAHGRKDAVMPFLDSLVKDGLLFSEAYSSGFRTSQGLLSVLSGIPSVPNVNLMDNLETAAKFPSLLNELKGQSYYTGFFYGGDLTFSNMYGYLSAANPDVLMGQDDFKDVDYLSSWGVSDKTMLSLAASQMRKWPEPFCGVLLTQSSHSPFDIPEPNEFSGPTSKEKFLASVHYLDESLKAFISELKKSKSFQNTVFVFLSDHGSLHLKDVQFHESKRFQIPLLFWGKPLEQKWKGKSLETLVGHHQLPYTLIHELGGNGDEFVFGKHMLDSSRSHAYWTTESAMAWLRPEGRILVEHPSNKTLYVSDENQRAVLEKESAQFYASLIEYILDKKQE